MNSRKIFSMSITSSCLEINPANINASTVTRKQVKIMKHEIYCILVCGYLRNDLYCVNTGEY